MLKIYSPKMIIKSIILCGLCCASAAENIEMLADIVPANVSPRLYIKFDDKIYLSKESDEDYYITASLHNYSSDTLFLKTELGKDAIFILNEGYALQSHGPEEVVFPSTDVYKRLNECRSLDDPSSFYEKIYIPFNKKTLLSYKKLELWMRLLAYNVSDKREVRYEQKFLFELGEIDKIDSSIPIKVLMITDKNGTGDEESESTVEIAVYGNKSEDQISAEDNQ